MGFYINHPTMDKVEYLEQNGTEYTERPAWPPPVGKCIIFLVDNGPFTAAGIAYDEREYNSWCDPRDTRPTRWFLLDNEKAIEFGGGPKEQEFLRKRLV